MSSDLSDLATTADWVAVLTDTERRLIEHAERGEPLNLKTGDPALDDVDRANEWDDTRVIRGRVIEVLVLGERADWRMHHRGLVLAGTRIDGDVNLDFGTLPAPLRFEGCVFGQPVTMTGAAVKALAMPGTLLPGLSAGGVDVTGDVHLGEGFTATGEVGLAGARIGGNLVCSGGSFSNEDGDALSAEVIDATGGVFLGQGFTATGEVGLAGARIGGDLVCSGGSFSNEDGDALSAGNVNVGGDVYLGEEFTATARVVLVGAKIGGRLDCSGGSFSNEGDDALFAAVLEVTGALVLRDTTFGSRINVDAASVGLLVDDVDDWPEGWLGDGFTFRDFAIDASADVADRLGWLRRQDGEFRPGPYTQLAAVYRRRGDPEAARTVLITRERLRTRELTSWRRPLRQVWGLISAYGYRPWRAIALLVTLIASGWVAFANTPMTELNSVLTRRWCSIRRCTQRTWRSRWSICDRRPTGSQPQAGRSGGCGRPSASVGSYRWRLSPPSLASSNLTSSG